MIVAAVAVLVMVLGLTAAVCVMQAWVIRTLRQTVRALQATEQRQTWTVRMLREEPLMLSQSARVITLWRPTQGAPS